MIVNQVYFLVKFQMDINYVAWAVCNPKICLCKKNELIDCTMGLIILLYCTNHFNG